MQPLIRDLILLWVGNDNRVISSRAICPQEFSDLVAESDGRLFKECWDIDHQIDLGEVRQQLESSRVCKARGKYSATHSLNNHLEWEFVQGQDGGIACMASVSSAKNYSSDDGLGSNAYLEKLNLGIIDINDKGVLVWANRHVCNVLSTEQVGIVGSHWSELSKKYKVFSFTKDSNTEPDPLLLFYQNNQPVQGDLVLCFSPNTDHEPVWMLGTFNKLGNTHRLVLSDITNRVVAERRLQEAQEVAKVGHWAWTPDKVTIEASNQHFINVAFTESPSDVNIYTQFKHVEEQDREHLCEVITEQLSGETRYVGDVRVFDGAKIVIIEMTIWSESRPDGRIVRVSGLSRNVTEERKAQEMLKNAEAYARAKSDLHLAALDAAADPVVITDSDGIIEYINPAFIRVTGYSPQEALGSYPNILKSGKTPKEMYRDLWKTIREGKVWRGELINRKRDGSHYHEKLVITPMLDDDGNTSHFIAIKEDITELVRMREERARIDQQRKVESDKIRMLIESMPNILFAVDKNGVITDWNNHAYECFNQEPHQVVGKSLNEVNVSWDRERIRQVLERAQEKGQAKLEDLPYQQTNGEAGIASLSVRMLAGGGSIWVGRDCTQEATQQASLLHAQKMESMGQLSSGIAHEINTPIQYVGDNLRFLSESVSSYRKVTDHTYSMLQDLQKGKLTIDQAVQSYQDICEDIDKEFIDDESVLALDQALNGVDKVSTIVKAMKGFAHPDDQEDSISNINDIIQNTVVVARSEYKYIADLECDLADDLPLVPCSFGSVSQVILNIIVNASHAIRDYLAEHGDPGQTGDIKISSRLHGDYVIVSLRDSGTGIPESILKRIFDPFFTTKDVGEGTGQGLALAHQIIVEQLGGKLEVVNVKPHGACFTIYLRTK